MNGKPRLVTGRLRRCPGFANALKMMGGVTVLVRRSARSMDDCGMRGMHDSPHLAHLSENLGYAPRLTLHPVIAHSPEYAAN